MMPTKRALEILNGGTTAMSATWGDPLPFADHRVISLRRDILPGDLGEYARALASHTETPVELSVFGVLGILSTALARKVAVEASPGYREPVNMYLCALMGPGNRKSAVVGAATKPLAEWDQARLERLRPEIVRLSSELKSRLAIVEKLRRKLKENNNAVDIQRIVELESSLPVVPPLPTLYTSDSTAEKLESLLVENEERSAVISDEGGIFDIWGAVTQERLILTFS